jgi:hypothetical protein
MASASPVPREDVPGNRTSSLKMSWGFLGDAGSSVTGTIANCNHWKQFRLVASLALSHDLLERTHS